MPRTSISVLAGLLLTLGLASNARAQSMSAADRDAALERVRTLAACVERQHAALASIVQLIRQSERQAQSGSDARVRQDAQAALESLIARAAEIQARAAECFGGEALPNPGARVIVQPPPPDPAADSVAQTGGTVRSVEADAALSPTIHVERGEQVDGQGRLDPAAVRGAVRAITPRLQRCYDTWLERGSLTARHLSLVFTFRGAGRARGVDVESSDFDDARLERCVRAAGEALGVGAAPSGGEATYSYRLRFGQGG